MAFFTFWLLGVLPSPVSTSLSAIDHRPSRAGGSGSWLYCKIESQLSSSSHIVSGGSSRPGNSFYKGGERNVGGLRITTTQKGRIDLKSLDRRDQSEYLQEHHPELAQVTTTTALSP